MTTVTEKKPYQSPQITQVVLRREQAILSTCTRSGTSLSVRGTKGCRTSNGCRRASVTTARDSGATTS
ncbi:MAG: hypothetical protein WC859_09165 [Elusimicrobiota bacterium]|jgi:hypothetical protein